MDDFGFLVPIAVLVTIIAAIVYGIRSVTKRRRDFPEADTGIGTVRRLYFYTISLVALLMFTSGIGLIVRFILEVIFVTDEFTRSGDEAFLTCVDNSWISPLGIPLESYWEAGQRVTDRDALHCS